MIGRGIVQAQLSDCVLGQSGGYSPGENVEEAIETWIPHSTPGVPLPLEKIVGDLRRGGVNGVDVAVGRTVFHNGGAGLDVVRCPACGANGLKSKWGDAVDVWYRGDDLAPHQCPICKKSSALTEWIFEPPWAFGHLGFYFWNWPPLNGSFINQVRGILKHKVVLVLGKL